MSAKEQVLKISVFFFIIYTADSSYDAIITNMFQKLKMPNVGPSSLAAMYTAFCFSITMSSYLKKSLKFKLCLSSIAYILNYVFGLIASLCECKDTIYYLVCTGTALNGLGAGLIWVTQGRYMHLICEIYGVNTQRGQLFGLFGVFNSATTLSGALITIVGLGYFSNTVYFAILIGFSMLSFVFVIIFIQEANEIGRNKIKDLVEENEEENFLQIAKIDVLLEKQRNYSQLNKYDIKEFAQNFCAFIPFLVCIMPYFIVLSVSMVIRSNLLSHLIPKQLPKQTFNKFMGLSLMMGGFGAILGEYVFGKMFDVFGTVFVGRIGLSLFFFSCWGYILATMVQNIALSFVIAFLWGFTRKYLFGLLPVVCSKHDDGRPQAFAITKLFPALFTIGFQVIMIINKNKANSLTFVIFSLLILPALYWLNDVLTAYSSVMNEEQKLFQKQIQHDLKQT